MRRPAKRGWGKRGEEMVKVGGGDFDGDLRKRERTSTKRGKKHGVSVNFNFTYSGPIPRPPLPAFTISSPPPLLATQPPTKSSLDSRLANSHSKTKPVETSPPTPLHSHSSSHTVSPILPKSSTQPVSPGRLREEIGIVQAR